MDNIYASENTACNWATLLFYHLRLKFVEYCYRARRLNTTVARVWLAHLVCWVIHKKS